MRHNDDDDDDDYYHDDYHDYDYDNDYDDDNDGNGWSGFKAKGAQRYGRIEDRSLGEVDEEGLRQEAKLSLSVHALDNRNGLTVDLTIAEANAKNAKSPRT